MASDHWKYPHYSSGPIWIDPRYYNHYYRPQPAGPWEQWKTSTTTGTSPAAVQPASDEQIRKIVREEIAELPIQFEIPDEPPDA